MLTIRPVQADDAAALAELLKPVVHLADQVDLQALIAESRQALDGDGPVPHRLVLVLEDRAAAQQPSAGMSAAARAVPAGARLDALTPAPTSGPRGALLGAVTLAGSTGLDLPRATYRTGTVVHASAELKMFHRAPTLLLSNDLTGCAELGRPVMAATDDAQSLQRLLVDAALLFVACHPDRFAARLVARLPGIGGAHGASPFWRGLGRHFHAGPLPQDSFFFPSPARSHIARLMPKHPLYSALLEPDAQACIGRHAASAQALAEALHVQGLREHGQIDLFDAGPVLEAEMADTAAMHGILRGKVIVTDKSPAYDAAAKANLVAPADTAHGRDWHVGLVSAALVGGDVWLLPEVAAALEMPAGCRAKVLAQN